MDKLVLTLGLVLGIAITSILLIAYYLVIPWEVAGVTISAIGTLIAIINIAIKLSREKKEDSIQTQDRKEDRQKVLIDHKIRLGEYGKYYKLKLEKGEHLKGKISTDTLIDVYFMSKDSFKKWRNNRSFTYKNGTEVLFETRIDYITARKGIWYLVLETREKKSAKVSLYVKISC